MEIRRCKLCGKKKPLVKFELIHRSSGEYRRRTCIVCEDMKKRSGEKRVRFNKLSRERHKKRRQDPTKRAQIILEDSRSSDRKRNRENTLSKEIIEEMISKECSYCGETEIKMSLDRKDNSIGHTKENCVPCCVRCNYLRRDMPYEAWIELADSMRKVREAGLFGSWIGGARK